MVFLATTNGQEHGTKGYCGAQAFTKFLSVREEISLGSSKGNKVNMNRNFHDQRSTLKRLEPHADNVTKQQRSSVG